jgi:hypothetical protein
MNRPEEANRNSKRLLLSIEKKQTIKSRQKHVPVKKTVQQVYPKVVMPEQPHGFIKAKRHTIY